MGESQTKSKDLLIKLKQVQALEIHLKQLNKEIMLDAGRLYETMEDEKVDSISIDGIEFKPILDVAFALNHSIVKEKKWDECLKWFKWLQEIGEDGLIKTRQSVHGGTRNKFLKDYIEDADNPALPEFIEMSSYGNVRYNKTAIKRLVEAEQAHGT